MDTYYITVQGDTWDQIAKEVYNDESKIGILMEYNFNHIGTFVFDSGVKILIPELEEEEETDLPDWRLGDEEESDE